MGIDVWLRRRSRQVAAPPVVQIELAPSREQPAAKVEIEAPPRRHAADVSATSWTAVSVGETVLLANLDTPHDRRFASDLALAAAGYPTDTPAIVSFTPTRSGGEEIAAFARGQMDRRRATLAILSRGAAVALGLALAEPGEVAVTTLNGVQCVVVPEIEALRANPEAKRNVWRTLNRRR